LALGDIKMLAVGFNPIVDINCFVLVGSKGEIGVGKGVTWSSVRGTILRHRQQSVKWPLLLTKGAFGVN